MTSRKYSVEEIDQMRAAVCAGGSDNIEDRLRTYMLNGSTPDELELGLVIPALRRRTAEWALRAKTDPEEEWLKSAALYRERFPGRAHLIP